MATRIRLKRMGTKKKPFYRVVVADTRSPRDGKFIEILGTYNPMIEPAEIKLKGEKVLDWIKKGAQPTEIVKNLMKKAGITVSREGSGYEARSQKQEARS